MFPILDLAKLHEAVRYEGGVSRRLFLAYAAGLSALPWLGSAARARTKRVAFSDDPFALGIASGDPSPSGVVLWTRLAPKPLEFGGGLEPENLEVSWEIAADESMRRVVRRGTAVAIPQLGHSVHVEAEGLEPDRWYWYRFRAGDAESPVGRTRTLPQKNSSPPELRFAVASCQHYEQGLYTAYEHMARDELDLVLFLGDYIYEGGGDVHRTRTHAGREIMTLEDYRIRHAQYKTDPLLQAMHARCPWVVTWDDHEVDNNYANDICEHEQVDPVDFLFRRANAYQAYYENMPLRRESVPSGPNMQLYRKLSFGQLAEFMVLDTRQYRTNQPNYDGQTDINEAALSPEATMLGAKQRNWVEKSLTASPAKWNVFAQQVMMGMVDIAPGDVRKYWMDEWPGYVYERQQLVKFLEDQQIANPIVLTGDYHANWVNNLRVDDRHDDTPVIATEFVGTSISSEGNGVDKPRNHAAILAENPCVQFMNEQRGYILCTVTDGAWQSDYRIVPYVNKPGAPVTTRASFVVEAGRTGAKQI